MVTKCNIVGSQMKNAQSVFICCSSANYTQSHRLVQTKFLRKWHCTKNRPHLPFYGFWPTVFTLDVSDLLIENSAGKSVSMFIVDNLGFINPSLCALTRTHARIHIFMSDAQKWQLFYLIKLFQLHIWIRTITNRIGPQEPITWWFIELTICLNGSIWKSRSQSRTEREMEMEKMWTCVMYTSVFSVHIISFCIVV